MIKNRSLIFVILLGILSSISLIYFYTIQRNFTKNHREFLLSISRLDNAQSDLKSAILLNSLYAYTSEDEVANETNQIQNDFTHLEESSILKSSKYNHILLEIYLLHEELKQTIHHIENYTMLNASIKNSIIFLTRHVENSLKLQKDDRYLYISANKILQRYNNVKKIQDLDYIDKYEYRLSSNSKNKKTLDFIRKFNLHSVFIFKKLPMYLEETAIVLNNTLGKSINHIQKDFSKIALNDFQSLDRFAFMLFISFIISISLIIILMIKSIRNHITLLKTASSLEHSLNYDILTDLHNRHAFEKDLQTLNAPHLLI